MEKEVYLIKNGRWVKANKWMFFKHCLKMKLKKWKIVNSYSNKIIPLDDMKRYFMLTPLEYNKSQQIYKDKGTIEYTFYPCGGIAWGVKVRILKTNEEIDITDVDSW